MLKHTVVFRETVSLQTDSCGCKLESLLRYLAKEISKNFSVISFVFAEWKIFKSQIKPRISLACFYDFLPILQSINTIIFVWICDNKTFSLIFIFTSIIISVI